MIKDSGNRTEFGTGAVRDIQKGKGRCDLMPLDVVAMLFGDCELKDIERFKETGNPKHLLDAMNSMFGNGFMSCPDKKPDLIQTKCNAMLEASIHFEEGAEKYGENNWQKGIPVDRYIDSAVRHYLKHLRGDTDERHDRAFMWNILCAIWTCEHMPELNPYGKKEYQE